MDAARQPRHRPEPAGELCCCLLYTSGRHADPTELRDRLLHTIACKAAIKGGWHTDPKEWEAVVHEVLTRNDLKYCPHGRPICLELTASQLERQFKRA